jgi:flagellar motility protein MotE (MotC chaperone)
MADGPAPLDVGGPAQSSKQKNTMAATFDPEMGPYFKRIYQPVLFKALQEFAPRTYESWQASETDRAARLAVIDQLSEQLAVSETDRAARLAAIDQLSEQLAASEADRAAQLATIDQLSEQLKASAEERETHLKTITQLDQSLISVGKRAAQSEVINSKKSC